MSIGDLTRVNTAMAAAVEAETLGSADTGYALLSAGQVGVEADGKEASSYRKSLPSAIGLKFQQRRSRSTPARKLN